MAVTRSNIANKASDYFRRNRDSLIKDMISSIYREKGAVKIIDLGGTLQYWERFGTEFLERHSAHITILNFAPGANNSNCEGNFSLETGDACNTRYDDNQFDLAHSNSVIEHLLSSKNMEKFSHEVSRIATKYYVQTPNYGFPIDPHFFRMPFFHWLPTKLKIVLLMNLPLANAGKIKTADRAIEVIEGAQLLTIRKMKSLFPDAELTKEKFFGLTKSIIVLKR